MHVAAGQSVADELQHMDYTDFKYWRADGVDATA
jgi:hypothetical protein